MTPLELQSIGRELFGGRWQAPLARALGISDRHVRRLLAGAAPILPGIERDVRRLALGGEAGDWPRDEWLVSLGECRREYISHLRPPRFVARVVAVDDEGVPRPGEEPADILTGITYSGGDYVLCEILWTDPPPGEAALARLFAEADLALDRQDEA